MCGIAGIISRKDRNVSSQPLNRMLTSQEHRGPDAGYGVSFRRQSTGAFAAGRRHSADALAAGLEPAPVWLGHRRLSILDLSDKSAQPLRRGDLHIVFNGELFNYIELRSELTALGEHFETSGDTEVLLASYRHWGAGCLERFNGIFAFAIFDASRGSLFAARDPFGVKPFHYGVTHDFLIFASEIKAISASGLVLRKWDPDVASAYLSYALTTAPQGRTFFENIRQIPPGHCLTLASPDDEPSVTRYYAPRITETPRSLHELVDEGAGLIRQSCRIRMRSDRDVGLCLSSGIDSANVAAALVAEGIAPECYSIDAASSSMLDEFPLITALADKLGLHVNPIRHPDAIPTADIVRYMLFNDEPSLFWGSYNQFHLYREMRKLGVIVSMSGHGGDELFCGYQRYYPAVVRDMLAQRRIMSLIWWCLRQSRHLMQDRRTIRSTWDSYSHPLGWANDYAHDIAALHLKHTIADPEEWISTFVGASSWGEQQQKSLFTYELQYLLRDADRNSMAHGIEERVPLLDTRLYEFCASVPLKDLCQDGYLKGLARQLFPAIPESLRFHQIKRGLYTDISSKLPQLQADLMPLVHRSPLLRELVDLQKLPQQLPGIVWWRLCSLAVLDVSGIEEWTAQTPLPRLVDDEMAERIGGVPSGTGRTAVIRHVLDEGLSYLEPGALHGLAETVGLIESAAIPGCIIEAGCALGGSTMVLATAKAKERPLHVFDVFGCIPPPGSNDGEEARARFAVIAAGESTGLNGKRYYGYEPDLLKNVQDNFVALGLPPAEHGITFVPGLYENTLYPSGPVALAHIDCDWYQSVKTCLERIAPHISPGGRMIIDDYDHYSGCRRAVDEFLEASNGQFIRERYARVHLVRTKADGQETDVHRPGD